MAASVIDTNGDPYAFNGGWPHYGIALWRHPPCMVNSVAVFTTAPAIGIRAIRDDNRNKPLGVDDAEFGMSA